MMFTDTIVAVSTPLAEGAISIIRLSGEEAIPMVDAIFSRNLAQAASHTITYGYIQDPANGQSIDEVFVSIFRAPKSYTTEDIVEINCHGGIFVTKQVLQLCIAQGARLAEEGEFTRRAFLHGRIDLTQAEAIMDLIEADDAGKSQLAIQAMKGSIRALLDPVKEDLIQMIAQIEVNIDYPEYTDVAQLTTEELLPKARYWAKQLKQMIEESASGTILRSGVKTAILGKPNVGKSSLLNALLKEDKAIVTDIAGTTRDLVEGYIRLQTVTLHLIDTAGIRDTSDKIEQMGIDKSKKVMEEAQLLLLVLDGSLPLEEEDYALLDQTKDRPRIIVLNKADDAAWSPQVDGIKVSAKEQSIKALVGQIEEMFAKHQVALAKPTFANERQIGLLRQAYTAIEQAIHAMEQEFELDFVVIDLKQAYQRLQDILGESMKKELLDELFSRFCLGK